MIRALVLAFAFLFSAPALAAPAFPPLSGRVVDQANLLTPDQEAQLTARLAALEQASSRQLVVATVSSLNDMTIEDYGYQLGRHWGLGQRGANNGAILLVAPNEKKVRIEVGYGLEPIMTDALSSQIIQNDILPRFRSGDFAGGIFAGTDQIIAQFQAPPEAAEQRVLAATQAEQRSNRHRGSQSFNVAPLVFWIFILIFVVLPIFARGMSGRRYRRGVSVWGPGAGRDTSGLGWFIAGMVLDNIARGGRGGGSSWGGGDWGGGGGGGASGGW